MRVLHEIQTQQVSGGALTPEQMHYVALISSQAVWKLATAAGLIALNSTPQGFFVEYVLFPAVTIASTIYGSEMFNRWYGSQEVAEAA